MEELGLVENFDQFKTDLVVERNASDPNRLDFLLPPDIINSSGCNQRVTWRTRDAQVSSRSRRTACVHGFKETPQAAYIAGQIRDRSGLDMRALVTLTDATVTLSLANGKVIALRDAWYAGEGKGSTGEATIDVRFEGSSAKEVL
jgi:hypothetical protein